VTSGDKELFELIDKINAEIIKLKSKDSFVESDEIRKTAAKCEALIKKANMFYGDNKKVQMLVYELKTEVKEIKNKSKLWMFVFWFFMGCLTLAYVVWYFGKFDQLIEDWLM
jgi:hypothetical protein